MISSYTYTHSVETEVRPEAIWALYEDVTTWPSWDSQAERIIRDGPFQTGTTGTMKFVGQEPLAYRLAKVETPREFVDETSAGPLVVRVSHLLEPLPDGRTRLTYSAEIDGPEDEAQQVGPMVTGDFPETMASLIALAKERSS
ncbi:MAG TPA: SRPBCC family protein [Propionibacteriaceae bacterium]|jgi:Polyketide cyclase / dehydrase and lipid transport